MKTLDDLFMDGLADIYDAEKRIAKALPKMAKAAQSDKLKEAIETHRVETEGHVSKVEEIFGLFDKAPKGKKCEATVGLLEEGDEMAAEFKGSPALDAAIISAAQKVEHYEIASYGCLKTWASLLENEEAEGLLDEILQEEKAADETLNELALTQSNQKALEGEEETKGRGRKVARSRGAAGVA